MLSVIKKENNKGRSSIKNHRQIIEVCSNRIQMHKNEINDLQLQMKATAVWLAYTNNNRHVHIPTVACQGLSITTFVITARV